MITGRIFWFLESATIAIIVALIVLMLIRLLVDGADLNPFGATHRTVRRLSDPFVVPVRGFLRHFHADPTYAPIVVIGSEEHTSEVQSPCNLVCRLLLADNK